ncbi:MAG: transporter substrate-binding domain-containing protein, partial [Rickettsiales bacterium]|nr:transporter substrate-binding domain-containing protein [Rickettsiales bacterium]
MFKKILLVLILLVSVFVNSGFADNKKLKVGTNAEYAPFEFYDQKNKMVGFDIDLAEIVAKKAGFSGVEFVDMKFDGLIQSLNKGDFDAIAAGLVITKDRGKKVLFTKSYAEESLVIVVKNNVNNVKTLDDLNGKKIGAEMGTTSADLAKTVSGAEVVELDTSEVFTALINNKVDAIIQTDSVAAYSIKQGKLPLKITSGSLQDDKKLIAFAVNKKNKELLVKLDKALEDVKKDGSFD